MFLNCQNYKMNWKREKWRSATDSLGFKLVAGLTSYSYSVIEGWNAG